MRCSQEYHNPRKDSNKPGSIPVLAKGASPQVPFLGTCETAKVGSFTPAGAVRGLTRVRVRVLGSLARLHPLCVGLPAPYPPQEAAGRGVRTRSREGPGKIAHGRKTTQTLLCSILFSQYSIARALSAPAHHPMTGAASVPSMLPGSGASSKVTSRISTSSANSLAQRTASSILEWYL